MFEEGQRVKVLENYTGPTELHGKEGVVAQHLLGNNSLIMVHLDGETAWDGFFPEELELVK